MAAMIEVENLGKRYRLGGQDKYYRTLREQVMRAVMQPWKWLRRERSAAAEFWALREVSFTVEAGEVVGLIGRNGAGKSTLLKLLGRITRPTEGRAKLYGRVGSLLEVGTGFHPELTGRENIYLSGNILGMTRREVKAKFSEIADFAEVDKFLDTPVKHYSSGMYVRLGFAIAAHLEPEILLVDEVLAVGDAQFQKKCLGKMNDVAKAGRTVLFVSHNMGAVRNICTRSIALAAGSICDIGETGSVISNYLSAFSRDLTTWKNLAANNSGRSVLLTHVAVNGKAVHKRGYFNIQKPITVEIHYETTKPITGLRVGFRLMAEDGTVVFTSLDSACNSTISEVSSAGHWASKGSIPGDFLNVGRYIIFGISADVYGQEIFFHEDPDLSFFVEQTGGVSGLYPAEQGRWIGVVCPRLSWLREKCEAAKNGENT